MTDKPKEPPKESADAGKGEEEIELDKTRMDIDVDKSPIGDVTGTDIHINAGVEKENTVDEEVRGRFQLVGDLWKKFLNGIKSFKGKAGKPSKKEPKSVSPILSSFVGLWVAPPEISIPGKSLFYLSRLLILAGGIVLFAILGESVADSFKIDSPFGWVLFGVAVFAGFLSVISIFLKRHACWFAGSPLIAVLLLVTLHTFFFQTTDPFFLSLKDKPPAFVFNQIWLLIIFFELLLILFVYPRFRPFLILLGIFCLYGIAGFGLNLYKGVPLEAGWEGVSILSYIPFIILQPTFVTLHFVILFLFFVNLVLILFFRTKLAAAQWIGMNLVVLLLAGTFGLITLQNNRIPNVLALFMEPPLELGLAEIEDQGRVVSLKTANYDIIKDHDTVGHYSLKLLPRGVSKDGAKEYYLSAINASGFPVLYLAKNEFILAVDEKPAPQWSITSLSQSERPSKEITKEQTPQYVLSVKFPDLGPQFEIKLPERGAEFSQGQSLEFSLSPDSPLAESYEIVVDGKSAEIKEDIGDERDFDFPLSDLGEGKHFVEITLKGGDGSAVKRSQEINILPPLSVVVESPMEGDYFGDELSVLARVSGPAGLVVSDVRFIVDDQELSSKSLPPYRTSLDTSQLSMGKHQLKVIARVKEEGGEKEFASETVIFKGDYSRISFSRPTLGEFVSFETPVEVSVPDEGGYSTVELFLDGKLLHRWDAPPYIYTWNTSELVSGDYLLRVQGKTEEGVKSSDSVRVSTGEGMLKVQTQSQRRGGGASAGFRYQSVVFVLDASISQWDSWNLESKWEWVKKVFSFKEVASKLKGIKTGVVVSGGGAPFDRHDCSDAERVYSLDSFNSRKILKVLDEKKPTGVSPLFAGVEKALEEKPKKIIVLTGGADSCFEKVPSDLAAKLGKSGVHLDVVTLGALEEDETKVLEELVKFGSGNLIVVNKPDELEEKIAKVLTLYYEIFAGDKLILSAPVDGKPLPLRPGEYVLKVFMDPPLEDQKITIRNGLAADLKIIVGGDKAEMKEEFTPVGQK